MAATLEEEIKRKRAEDLLSDTSSDDVSDSTLDTSEPDRKDSDYVLVPEAQVDQPKEKPGLTRTYQGWGEPIPEELLRPSEKRAEGYPLEGESLVSPTPPPTLEPIVDESLRGPTPDILPQVERGELVKTPVLPAPDTLTQVERAELVKAPVEPAPDRLDQVERATLVKLPAKPAPDTLAQVERAVPRAAPVAAPDTLPQVEKGILIGKAVPAPSGTIQGPLGRVPIPNAPIERVGPEQIPNAPVEQVKPEQLPNAPLAPGAAQAKPAAEQETTFMGMPILGREAQPQVEKPSVSTAVTGERPAQTRVVSGRSLEGTDLRLTEIITAAANALPPGYTVRPTSGMRSSGQGQHTLGKAQDWQIFDPKGNPIVNRGDDETGLYTLLAKNAYGYQEKYHPELTGQFQWGGQFGTSGRNLYEPDLMHFDIGGRRGRIERYSRESIGAALPSAAGQVAGGQPEKGFIKGRATTFGYHDPDDPGVGSPKLGKINTNEGSLVGVAVPEEALRAQIGANPAAWRRARVEIVTSDGRHMLVPIVDLGPGDIQQTKGIAADFTHGLASVLKHSDQNNYQFRIIPNAGVDVMKNPQAFVAEQAQLAKGVDLSPKAKAPAGGYVLVPESEAQKADSTQQVQAQAQAQQNVLSALHEHAPNMPSWYHALEKPIPGVTDVVRNATREEFKKQITAYAQDYYKESDPDKAFQRIMQAPNLLTSAGEIITKAPVHIQHALLAWSRGLDANGENRIIDFINKVHPEATPEARAGFVREILSKPAGNERTQFVSALYSSVDPQITQGIDLPALLDSIDTISQPGYQEKRKAEINTAVAKNLKDLRTDPTMENTWGGTVSDAIAQMPKNLGEALFPVIGQSAMTSEIYFDTLDGLRKEHPGWSEDQLKAKAGAASVPQVILQEVVNLATMGLGGGLVKGITNPVARIAANSILHGGIAGTAATVQQGVANVATGRPVTEGMPQAGIAGGIQGMIGGAMHVPEARPRDAFEATTGPEGAPVRGPTEKMLEEGQVRVEQQPMPVEPLPVEPAPVIQREQPVVREEPAPEADELALNRQTEDLYKQYQAELKLLPIEERPQPVDIKEGERRAAELAEPPGKVGQPVPEGLDVGLEQGRPNVRVGDVGYPAPERGADVPQELRPLPRALEVALPPEERAALQPLVDVFAHRPAGTDVAKTAYENLFDAVYERFAPLFKAGGIKRIDNPSDYKGIAAARSQHDGRLELLLNHPDLESAARGIMDRGNDPVAYLHGVLQEELIHHAHNLTLRDKWVSEKAKAGGESFGVYRSRKMRSLVDNWLAARDRAQKRNPDLAREMTQGLHDSMMLYDDALKSPTEAEAHFRDIYDKAKKGYLDEGVKLSNIVAEMVRQMVQLKGGNLVEPYWRQVMGSAMEWLQNAIQGLKSLYTKLGEGQPLAKTELARLIMATQRKLDTLERRAGKTSEKPAGPAPEPATIGESFVTEHGGSEVLAKEVKRSRLAETFRSSKRWLSAVFKSGQSAMLDYKETQPLALAIRRRASLEQKFGQRAQVMQLADAFNKVKAADRPRVVKEFTDYVRAEQNKQPLPRVSADTRAILEAGKNTLEQLGQISKELNVHVKTSDGKIRPMKLIGRDYYPRMISDDMRDIFNHRDDTRAAEFNNLVNRQIARGVVKSRDEFIDKFTQAVTPDPTSNGHFGNIEKAREAQLPLEFYDFSPEALIKYANRSTDRLAQIAAYDQKLSSKGKDLFDHTIEQVQRASGYSHADKQTIINRIEQERKAEYQEREKSNLGKVSSLARSGASGAFLGNPITSAYNLIGGAGQNLTFGGPGAFFKTAAKFATIKGALENIKEARERNILKSNLSDILTDYDLVTNQGWATKGVQGFTKTMLKWGGQNLTEGINRAFAMQQAKYILNRFARIYGQDNASARSLYAMINRRGVHDLQGLAREKGQGPLTDEFLRQYVMDVHGNYGPSQSAAHIFDSGAGKVLLQFQKWGANTQRMATREFLMPLVKAARDRQPADFAYHLMRNLGYIAAATGTGAASQLVSNWVRDKDPRKPSIGEIYTRFAHGENWKALQYALQRAQDMVILSGFAGTLGNYSDLANQLTGADPGGRVKDPLHPPVISLFQPFQELIQGWHGEGGAAPSPRILDKFAQSISSAYRVGKQTLLTGANAAGLRFKPGEEMAAQNDLAFLRNRVKMFEDDNPEFQAKKELKGTQSMSFAGRSQFDPYKDRIQAALLTGHPEEANLAVADWLDRFPPGEQQARRKSIQQSVQASSPIKPGGSYKLDTELQFLSWVKQNLPPEEARKIFATAQTYAKTAMDTGILGRSKTMQRIAGIDYDKFVVVTPKATVVAARPSQPNQPSLAEQIRKEVAAKRLMLQHR